MGCYNWETLEKSQLYILNVLCILCTRNTFLFVYDHSKLKSTTSLK